MRNRRPLYAVAIAVVSTACSAIWGFDDLRGPGASGDDGGGVDGGDAQQPGDGTPPAPSSIAFTDEEIDVGIVGGTIRVGHAPDESAITTYDVYWANGPTSRLTLAGTTAKTGMDLRITLAPVAIPAGATHFLAVARGAKESAGVSTPITDNFPRVSLIDPDGGGITAPDTTLVDDTAAKVLVLGSSNGNPSRPVLYRCALDGSACTRAVLDAAKQTGRLSATLGGGRLHVGTTTALSPIKGELYECNTDGTGCAETDLDAVGGEVNDTSVAYDAKNGAVLLVAQYLPTYDDFSKTRPALYRFVDGGASPLVDLASGRSGAQLGETPTALIDEAGGSLVAVNGVAFVDGSKPAPGYTRCSLTGTGCVFVDASKGKLMEFGPDNLAATVDPNGTLLIAAIVDTQLWLLHCSIDTNACAADQLSTSTGGGWTAPSIVLDREHQKILVAVTKQADGTLVVFRCDTTGAACRALDLTATGDAGTNSGGSPKAAIDGTSHRLFVATRRTTPSASFEGLLYVLDLW
jgi:hypothetical protein